MACLQLKRVVSCQAGRVEKVRRMKWCITEGLQTDLSSPALPANMVQYRDSQDNMVMGYSLLLYSQDSVDN